MKNKTNENEFAGMPFDDDEQEEHEQVAIEKKHIEDSIEEMLIHISKTEVANYLGGIAAKLGADDMQRVSIKETNDENVFAMADAVANALGHESALENMYKGMGKDEGVENMEYIARHYEVEIPDMRTDSGMESYWDAFDQLKTAMGDEAFFDNTIQAMETQTATELFDFIMRNYEISMGDDEVEDFDPSKHWEGKAKKRDLGDRIAEALSKKLKEYGWDDDEDEFGGEDLSQYEKEFPDAFNAGGDRDEDAEAAAAKDAEIDDLMSKYGMSDGEPEEEEVDEAVQSDGRTPEQVELANKVAEIMETDPDYQFTLKRFVEKFLRYSQSGGSVESSLEAACPDWVPGQDIFSVVKKAKAELGDVTTMKESGGSSAEQFADENGLSVEYDNEGQVVLYADAEQQAQMRMSGADRVIADEGWAIEPMADGQVAIYTDEYADGFDNMLSAPMDVYQEDTGVGHSQLRHSRLNETLMKWAIK